MKLKKNEMPRVGYVTADGKLQNELFDPTNPQHVEMMKTFARNCEDCREFLRRFDIYALDS